MIKYSPFKIPIPKHNNMCFASVLSVCNNDHANAIIVQHYDKLLIIHGFKFKTTCRLNIHTYPVKWFWFLLAENRPPKRLNRCGSADDPFLRPSTKLSSNRNLAFFRNNWKQNTTRHVPNVLIANRKSCE